MQRLAVADLLVGSGEAFRALIPSPGILVYSDPPWNPGNEKWWRRHARAEPPIAYDQLLDAWCNCVAACCPRDVFCEQSFNAKHRSLFIDAVARCPGWQLPLLKEWTVYYGSPGSRSCLRPNALLHFGSIPLTTDPSGLSGEAMTQRVFDGLALPSGTYVADPCMGKGMTSRQAHKHGCHCFGTELNAARLDYAIKWLLKNGYTEVL